MSDPILEHYRKEAAEHGVSSTSTMKDEITRGRELEAILRLAGHLARRGRVHRLLEVGCGNGLLLGELRECLPAVELTGLEYSPEMAELARGRGVERCSIEQGDVRDLPFADGSFDLVVSERCLINVLDRREQERSLAEVAGVLRPGGHYVCVEAFANGLELLNKARVELGLEPNQAPDHNLWLEQPWFDEVAGRHFEERDGSALGDPGLPPRNFLSSHYFTSRVLYPAVTRREILYNTELVKFLSFLPPIGEYSPIELRVLERR